MGLQDKLKDHRDEKINAEKKAGAEFMAANKTKPGVVEMPNGIQYQIVKEGSGDKPKPGSTIKAHYRGSLINGKEFDSSYSRNQPFTAPLNALIQGWQVMIPMMPLGSVWRLWIPSELAYGDRGAGGAIPGGATLQFDIELLEIKN